MKREDVLNALLAALQAGIIGPEIARNLDLPEDVPSAGQLILRDGDLRLRDTVLSPLTYLHQNRAELELIVIGDTAAIRDAAIDGLLASVSVVILVNRTLGGLAEFMDADDLVTAGLPTEGAAGIKAVLLPILIDFSSDSPLG